MATRPNYPEIFFILIIGALQPLTEISFGPRLASYYNVLASIVVVAYILHKLIRRRVSLQSLGLRLDNFQPSLWPYVFFTIAASLLLYTYGLLQGRPTLPISFWYLILLYPFWGFAQQFILQNFIVKNLNSFLPNIYLSALAAAAFFSLAHAPSVELMSLTALAGLFFTLLYHRYPNLFLLGISHGFLGALAFYFVLGQNQWEILREYFILA